MRFWLKIEVPCVVISLGVAVVVAGYRVSILKKFGFRPEYAPPKVLLKVESSWSFVGVAFLLPFVTGAVVKLYPFL